MMGYSWMMLVVVMAVVIVSWVQAEIGEKDFVPSYQCSLCLSTVDKHLAEKVSLSSACLSMFTPEICSELNFPDAVDTSLGLSSRNYCRRMQKCPAEDAELTAAIAASLGVTDVRITRALGKRGYDKVRVSVISNTTIANDMFTYQQPFQYRWTDKVLSTGIVSVTPGATTTLTIGGQAYNIRLPKENEGVRGIILADPCFQSEWITCLYKSKFHTKKVHTSFLNAAFAHDDVSYWQILGDNFYDQDGFATSTWFAELSSATKSGFFSTVPGNHDFWVHGSPRLYTSKDQLGNGFMQFYGQDVIASVAASPTAAPYDFVNNPDAQSTNAENLPPASNYFFYNKVGNVVFIGFSGAHRYATMTDYVREACDYAVSSQADSVFLLGHWNNLGDGADADATVPNFYQEMIKEPSCQPIAEKIRYFMGHKHCNLITQKDIGFMVGAQGMSDAQCGGAFGIPVVDTTEGRFRVYYFPLAQADQFDNSEEILACIQQHGVSGCYQLATVWADVPL